MKRFSFLIGYIFFIYISSFSQSKTYPTAGLEMIFSLADIDDKGVDESSILRWAPFLNIQGMLNHDLNKHLGLFTGLAVRNVGYIYGDYTDQDGVTLKKKFRSYNLGLPVGIKIGNLNKLFFYGGYEVELPFAYKEKTFSGGDKINTITGWFSPREELFQHGFLAGVQFRRGHNIKFKYYLSEFHNRNYIDGSGNKPYEGLKSQIFYFSFNAFLFSNRENMHYKKNKTHDTDKQI